MKFLDSYEHLKTGYRQVLILILSMVSIKTILSTFVK